MIYDKIEKPSWGKKATYTRLKKAELRARLAEELEAVLSKQRSAAQSLLSGHAEAFVKDEKSRGLDARWPKWATA
jgi:hypothetical protein